MFAKRKHILTLTTVLFAFVFCGENRTEEELFAEAQKQYSENNFNASIDLYGKLVKHYPESDRVVDAYFMTGFIYANHIKDFTKAKEFYEKVTLQFPSDSLASSAKFELEFLGKSQEELDQELQKRIQQNAETAIKKGGEKDK